MYTFIYNLYFCLKRKEKKAQEEKREISKIAKKMIDRIEWLFNIPLRNWYMNFPSKRRGITKKSRKQKIIVSLTSYPQRISTVWLTIESILHQSVKPDKIILWLAKTQFKDIEELPKTLQRQRERGLSIQFCDDLRSHKKYYYVMQKYPEDLIILADDDMFYPRDTIRRLLEMHSQYPNDICTMSAQVIEPHFEAKPSLWRNPKLKEDFKHSEKIQIFTGSGSLYPPNSLDTKAFDKKLIQELCPYADDLWLTFMAYRKNTKISVATPWRAFPITIYGTSEGSLWYINGANGENDKQWKAILEYFNGGVEC